MALTLGGALIEDRTESILGEARGKQALGTGVNEGGDPGESLDSAEAETPSFGVKPGGNIT